MLHNIAKPKGNAQSRKKVGRGPGTNLGKTCGKGHKGQLSRSGAKHRVGFEGGQTPLHRRLPKFGFTNLFKKEYKLISLDLLESLEAKEVTVETLKNELGLKDSLFKVLGNGEIKSAKTIQLHKVSKSAKAMIEKVGGTVKEL